MNRRFLIAIVISTLWMFTSGCAARKLVTHPVRNHIVSIDREGNFVPIKSEPIDKKLGEKTRELNKRLLKSGKPTALGTHLDELGEALENCMKGAPNGRIVIYIHGGLTSLNDSFKDSINDYEYMKSDSVCPVFINWNSEPVNSYIDHLFWIRDGKKKWVAGPLTSPIYLLTDVLRVIANAPFAWGVQSVHAIKSACEEKSRYYKKDDPSSLVRIDAREPTDDYANPLTWFSAVPQVFTTPVVHALGRPTWDMMQRRTRTMFHTPYEFVSSNSSDNSSDIHSSSLMASRTGWGALSYFMEWFTKFHKKNRNYKVDLIGHSMGTIVLNEALNLYPDISYSNIVYMAAASNIEDSLTSIRVYLGSEAGAKTKFYSMMLDARREDLEGNWYGFVPVGSLLVWIDIMYSTPPSRMHRTFGRWENMWSIRHVFDDTSLYPAKMQKRLHFRVLGAHYGDPQRHGDFRRRAGDNGCLSYWNPKFWWLDEQTDCRTHH